MIEANISNQFSNTFKNYSLWKPANRVAGWPDIAIQFGLSQLVWCELKITTIRADGRILLNNFAKEQAAFMYKWQRNNGFCFLFAGLLDRPGELYRYIIVRPFLYREWLTVNKTLYELKDIHSFINMEEVLKWFKSTFVVDENAVYRRKESDR
jgi:hypothetical protein